MLFSHVGSSKPVRYCPQSSDTALNNFLIVTATHLEVFGPLDDFNALGRCFPWWLHVCGVILALIGLCWFNKVSKSRGDQVETLPQTGRPSKGTALVSIITCTNSRMHLKFESEENR